MVGSTSHDAVVENLSHWSHPHPVRFLVCAFCCSLSLTLANDAWLARPTHAVTMVPLDPISIATFLYGIFFEALETQIIIEILRRKCMFKSSFPSFSSTTPPAVKADSSRETRIRRIFRRRLRGVVSFDGPARLLRSACSLAVQPSSTTYHPAPFFFLAVP